MGDGDDREFAKKRYEQSDGILRYGSELGRTNGRRATGVRERSEGADLGAGGGSGVS